MYSRTKTQSREMILKWLTVQLLFIIIVPKSSFAALQIDAIRNSFFELEDQLWSYLIDHVEVGKVEDPEMHLMRKFQEFDKELQLMPQDPEYGLNVTRRSYDFMLLYADLIKIHDLYNKFAIFQNLYLKKEGITEFKREALIADIVDDVLNDPNNNVDAITRRISDRIFKSNDLMLQLVEITSNGDYMCNNYAQTPQQVYLHLYNAITLTDLKGYMLTQYAVLSEALYVQGNQSKLSLELRQKFKERTHKYIVSFRDTMQVIFSHNKLWRCDPKTHIEGETYEEITRLLQFHFENEADLNKDRSCRQTCDDYSLVRNVYGCYDSESRYCQKRKQCSGRLLNCQEASHRNVCISDSSSLRRYDYIKKTEDGTILGNQIWCSEIESPSWIRWFDYCSSCMCLCDEPGRFSDRFFNLRQVMSNVSNNRVITGVRLVKKNRIIHIQIQEGKLLPYGYIDQSTVQWVPVDDYRITDTNVRNGEDYHTMSFEERELYLDDLQSHEADHIITGVGFTYQNGHLKFQVNVRKFNFKTAALDIDNHFISGGEEARRRLNLYDADVPLRLHNSDQNFDANLKVQFTQTSLYMDAGQTTVPFIDSQPVTTSPPSPLKGVGIHWRGKTSSGGFVAPIISAYDFEQKMGVAIPDPPLRD